MRINGGLLSNGTSEWVRLRRAWKKWNASCHPDDQISWNEFLEEHSQYETDSDQHNRLDTTLGWIQL